MTLPFFPAFSIWLLCLTLSSPATGQSTSLFNQSQWHTFTQCKGILHTRGILLAIHSSRWLLETLTAPQLVGKSLLGLPRPACSECWNKCQRPGHLLTEDILLLTLLEAGDPKSSDWQVGYLVRFVAAAPWTRKVEQWTEACIQAASFTSLRT